MKNIKIKIILFVFACMVFGVSQGLTAEWSVVFKEIQAKYEKFDKDITDMIIVYEISAVIPPVEMTSRMTLYKKGKKIRVEVDVKIPNMPEEMGGLETVFINDGKDAWMISSVTGKKKISLEELAKVQTNSNWWEMVSEKARITGTEMVTKRRCYVVEIGTENVSGFARLWLDKKKLVLVKGESRLTDDQTLNWVHSDFRKIKDDWEIPYMTRIYSNNELVSTAVVKSFQLNKSLSDDLFDPDKVHVKEFNMQNMMKMMMPQGNEE